MPINFKIAVTIVGIGGLVFDAIIYLYRKYHSSNDKSPEVEINREKVKYDQVLFFPDLNVSELPDYNESLEPSKERTKSPLEELGKILKSAHKTIDICVFVITSLHLADIIVESVKQGVLVRVITDEEQMKDFTGCQIEKFRSIGIPVRSRKGSHFLMHHKFAIIDSELIVNGSFNWTRTAMFGNNENLIISSSPTFVSSFNNEFEKLWTLFNPDNKRQMVR